MIGNARGLPELAITPTASSVSEKSSLGNLPTASSNGPASTGSTIETSSSKAKGSARKFLNVFISTGQPRQKRMEGGDYRRLPLFIAGQVLRSLTPVRSP